MNSRRDFIKTTALTGVGLTLTGKAGASLFTAAKPKRPIHVFSKCLQFLNYQELAKVVAEHGFYGADLAVRNGGQVLPENVETDLPKALKALRSEGVDSNMIVTKIIDANHPDSERIIKTMADLGIQHYRMGSLNYDLKNTMPENLDAFKIAFEKLEKLNRKYGVTGNYQNHSGVRVGGPVWDLYEILKDRNPDFIGVQYDIRHATVEGGQSWPLGMKLLSPWIRTTDIKDFVWAKNEKGEWKIKNVPLGEGMVDFKKYFQLLKEFNIETPVSIHYEYDLGGAEKGKKDPTMDREEIYTWLKRDITYLKEQFKKYKL
jgi:L-ribulose-5-phosphate 3-epimerase